MRIVFMGTPDFAVPSLSALAAQHEVALVLTRPDAIRGRGKKLVPSAVGARAQELGLKLVKTSRIDVETLAQLREAKPDCICVAAYGCILPDEVLELAPFGCVNVHASLLPKWRGAAPIQRAMLAGEEEIGVSIMKVVHELDAGAYARQASLAVGDMNCSELTMRLAEVGAQELLHALDEIETQTVVWKEQDEAAVSYAAKVSKQELLLDPADSARENHLRIRSALDASPARFTLNGRGMRATRSRLVEEGSNNPASQGTLRIVDGRVFLGCVDGAVELLRVQADGKRELAASDWARGQREDEMSWSRI